MLKLSLILLVSIHMLSKADQISYVSCQSQLYCEGSLLELVQLKRIFPNSKTFVDLATKETNDETIVKWERLFKKAKQDPPTSVLKRFVKSQFSQNNQGLTKWRPIDFNPEPWFLNHIQDEDTKQFTRYIVKLWRVLARNVTSEEVEKHSSLLHLPNGFIIPSSGTSEMYYWNSYWVVEGLLLCEMDLTAKGVIDNFIHLIKYFGFVPAGNRLYYTNISQPPLLAFMVWQYLLKTRNFNWLNSIVKYLDRELQWWVEHKMIIINIDGVQFHMARYITEGNGPRPEMYAEDYDAVKEENEDIRQDIFNDIKAAAESGWGASSRWMMDNQNGFDYMRTSSVSPVDLNSILYGAFLRLSSMYLILEDFEKRSYWYNLARELKKTIQVMLWDEHDGIWYDYNLEYKTPIRRYAASNLTPLWVNAYNDSPCLRGAQAFRAVSYLVKLGINKYHGGIPVTLKNTGEEWDFPNAWPPMQSMIVQGLRRSGHRAAQLLAEELAKNWITANMKSWKKRGRLYEWYDAENPGQSDAPKRTSNEIIGGWAGGVLLDFINTYFVMTQTNSTLMVVA